MDKFFNKVYSITYQMTVLCSSHHQGPTNPSCLVAQAANFFSGGTLHFQYNHCSFYLS